MLTPDAVQASDVVVTMGCGDECPFFPGKRYEDWVLDDPAGQGIEAVRPIRDEIRRRVERLVVRRADLARTRVTVCLEICWLVIWAGVNGKLTHCFLPNISVWSFDHGEVGSSDWP